MQGFMVRVKSGPGAARVPGSESGKHAGCVRTTWVAPVHESLWQAEGGEVVSLRLKNLPNGICSRQAEHCRRIRG
jgi:hypothetical protein